MAGFGLVLDLDFDVVRLEPHLNSEDEKKIAVEAEAILAQVVNVLPADKKLGPPIVIHTLHVDVAAWPSEAKTLVAHLHKRQASFAGYRHPAIEGKARTWTGSFNVTQVVYDDPLQPPRRHVVFVQQLCAVVPLSNVHEADVTMEML